MPRIYPPADKAEECFVEGDAAIAVGDEDPSKSPDLSVDDVVTSDFPLLPSVDSFPADE